MSLEQWGLLEWLSGGGFLLMAVLYAGMILWMVAGWKTIFSSPLPSNLNIDAVGISIIVAAHNEAHNLQRFLPFLLEQRFHRFEVIVVCDRCTDGSVEVVNHFQSQNQNLKLVKIFFPPPDYAPKKWAVTQGISAAEYPYIALIDADCYVSSDWLQYLAQNFVSQRDLILGLGWYERRKGLLNAFIQFETFYAAFQYMGMAAQGWPYMAVGRNLAYTQKFFNPSEGFGVFKDMLSGDDDLLVNARGRQAQLGYLVAPDSASWSIPEETLTSWLRQKWRHHSASRRYSWPTKTLLGLTHFSHMGFYLGFIASLSVGIPWIWVGIVYLARLLFTGVLMKGIQHKIKAPLNVAVYPILDLFFFLYNLFVVPIGLIKRPEWRK
ncbi:MAG: glycosyltransferase [Bacteroidota bacterium]